MLNTANSGKYLYGRYARERAKAVENKESFSDDEIDYLEITGTEGTGVNQDRTYEVDTAPVDSNVLKGASPKGEGIDIRNLPQMGGK